MGEGGGGSLHQTNYLDTIKSGGSSHQTNYLDRIKSGGSSFETNYSDWKKVEVKVHFRHICYDAFKKSRNQISNKLTT